METRETRASASEVKFLVSAALGDEVEKWAKRWLLADPHGAQYNVTSLYFDTPAGDVLNRNGSFARGKYRIRRYDNSPTVFLERKLRAKTVVTKRRSIVDLEDLPLLESHTLDRNWNGGYWFHRRLQARGLQPATQISYLRSARVLDTKAGFMRLTLDRQLAAQPIDKFEFSANPGEAIFPDGKVILELKFRHRMPSLFRELIDDLVLTPQPLSKFRLAAGALANVHA
ncbi:VTC domain-containing protein [Bryobacterales bacterium F-183]|nr:VTC domain-containing protein [Bryobacterales bacterium F-183]